MRSSPPVAPLKTYAAPEDGTTPAGARGSPTTTWAPPTIVMASAKSTASPGGGRNSRSTSARPSSEVPRFSTATSITSRDASRKHLGSASRPMVAPHESIGRIADQNRRTTAKIPQMLSASGLENMRLSPQRSMGRRAVLVVAVIGRRCRRRPAVAAVLRGHRGKDLSPELREVAEARRDRLVDEIVEHVPVLVNEDVPAALHASQGLDQRLGDHLCAS